MVLTTIAAHWNVTDQWTEVTVRFQFTGFSMLQRRFFGKLYLLKPAARYVAEDSISSDPRRYRYTLYAPTRGH